jgi:hypothetical protein
MKHILTLTVGLFVGLFAFLGSARADIDLEVAGLIGTGAATGNSENNPYGLQLGALGELSIGNYVVGVRGTRSLGNDDECGSNVVTSTVKRCRNVKDLRTIGADLGYAWNIAIVHIGPRVGFGYINEKDGDRVTGYMEPGAVAEVSLLLFVVGLDVRYRVAFGEKDLNGVLAYLRLGLRF